MLVALSYSSLMFAAMEETKLLVVEFNLDVICYAPKQLPLTHAISKLIITGLTDQLISVKNTVFANLLLKQPQVTSGLYISLMIITKQQTKL